MFALKKAGSIHRASSDGAAWPWTNSPARVGRSPLRFARRSSRRTKGAFSSWEPLRRYIDLLLRPCFWNLLNRLFSLLHRVWWPYRVIFLLCDSTLKIRSNLYDMILTVCSIEPYLTPQNRPLRHLELMLSGIRPSSN